jgi:hypothetical protein
LVDAMRHDDQESRMVPRAGGWALALALWGCGTGGGSAASDAGPSSDGGTAGPGESADEAGTSGDDNGDADATGDPDGSSDADTGSGPPPDDLPPAPELGTVEVIPNRDSVIVVVPDYPGVQDYRVFVVDEGVEVDTTDDGREQVTGATIFCAGREQHARPLSEHSNPLLRTIEVAGLTSTQWLAVEALDRPCPFVGHLGLGDFDIDASAARQQDFDTVDAVVRTENVLRETYGSLIFNGQGHTDVQSEPAPPDPPMVLARALVEASPLGTDDDPLAWFEDFDDAEDQFVWQGDANTGCFPAGAHLSNSRFNLYTCGVDGLIEQSGGHAHSQAIVDRGRLTTYVADTGQEIFGTTMLVPKQAVHVSDDAYLHVTFEVHINPSQRRYMWFSLCGSETPGETFAADGSLTARMQMSPFFYLQDGLNPFVEGWSCLQMFPFVGGYYELPVSGAVWPTPEASLQVLVNAAYGHQAPNGSDNVAAVGPSQYDASIDGCPGSESFCGWYRTQDASGQPAGELMDDKLRHAPRTRFDLYIRRDRLVVYLDGQYKLCNDFPQAPLTLADGALGFGHVLYHSTAEKLDLVRPDWDHGAQQTYLTTTPWVDERNWDNLGFEEGVGAPAGFDEDTCFVSPIPTP